MIGWRSSAGDEMESFRSDAPGPVDEAGDGSRSESLRAVVGPLAAGIARIPVGSVERSEDDRPIVPPSRTGEAALPPDDGVRVKLGSRGLDVGATSAGGGDSRRLTPDSVEGAGVASWAANRPKRSFELPAELPRS